MEELLCRRKTRELAGLVREVFCELIA